MIKRELVDLGDGGSRINNMIVGWRLWRRAFPPSWLVEADDGG